MEVREADLEQEFRLDIGSVCSELSSNTKKSHQSAKLIRSSARTNRSISSRARPIKEHEDPGSQLLAIDLKSEENTTANLIERVPTFSRISQHSAASTRLTSEQSSRCVKSVADLDISSRLMSSGLLRPQSSKTYTSLIQNPPKSNSRVKMPFKQSTVKPQQTAMVVSPGREMSERTVLATSVINRVLREHVPPKVQHVHGRLLKARLKPLEPVQITSPTIRQCRGIVAETRAYTASNSKTFQRWKAILSSAQHFRPSIPDIKDSMSIEESLHRTSEATSPVPSMDPSSEVDFDLNDTNVEVVTNKENVSYLNSSNSDFTAEKTSELNKKKNYYGTWTESKSEQNSSQENSMKTEAVEEYKTENVSDKAKHSGAAVPMKNTVNKRPQSAFFPQDLETELISRPRTVGENIRPKSVRFADENKRPCSGSKEISSESNNIEEKNKKNKSKVSCRPESGDQVLPDDQDDSGNSGQDGESKSSHSTVTCTESTSNHNFTDSNNLSSEGKSKSSSNTNSRQTDGNLGQHDQLSDDKKLSKPRPKSASVFYETSEHRSDHSQQLHRVTLDIKSHIDERFANYKNKKIANDTIKNKETKICKCDMVNKRDESIENKSKDVDHLKTSHHVAHLPPNGLNQQFHKKPRKKTTGVKNRPISASAYINKDTSQRKSRSHSTGKVTKAPDDFIFAERSDILSRHGLLGKKRPSSAPGNLVGHEGQYHTAGKFRPRSSAKSKGQKRLTKCQPQKPARNDISLNNDNMADAEEMWKELPDDDDLLDDPIMCKFDELENEFLLNKAELQAGKLKYAVKEKMKEVESWENVPETEVDEVEQSKTDLVIIPQADVTVVDDVEDILCSSDGEKAGSDLLQVDESKIVTLISSYLYKKTNLFVPVSRRKCSSHHHRAHSKRSATVRGDAKVSSGLDKMNNVSAIRDNITGENNALIDDEIIHNLCETAANILGDSTTGAEVTDEQLKKSRWQLEQDYPNLTRIIQDKMSTNHMCTTVADEDLTVRQRRKSDADSVCQGDLYTELLHAYRCYFEESSDDDRHDDYDEGIITKSKKIQLHQKSARFSSCHQLGLRKDSPEKQPDYIVKFKKPIGDLNILEPSSTTKARPWSGTTNDSGLESDTTSNEGDREREGDIDEIEYKNTNNPTSFTNSKTISDDHIQKATLKSLQPETKIFSALEIVAQAKTLSKPRKQHHYKEDMSTLCLIPPLCFRLNARPPSGHLFYFAYDQNMSFDRMVAYLITMNKPLVRYWALLFGFDLVFNKKADINSNMKDVGGFPNLNYNASSSVEGCLYQLTLDQLECLDKFMGYPQICEHIVLPVWMSNCSSPDELGVAQYCVPACTYIARDEFTWTEPIHPNEFALSQCIKAADLLTPAYKDHLLTFVQPSMNTSTSVLAH